MADPIYIIPLVTEKNRKCFKFKRFKGKELLIN